MLPRRLQSAQAILASIPPSDLITVVDPGKSKGKARENPLPLHSIFQQRRNTNNPEIKQANTSPSLKRRHEEEDGVSPVQVWDDVLPLALEAESRQDHKRLRTECLDICSEDIGSQAAIAGPSGLR